MSVMWKPEFFLGIPEIDAEHCRILEIIGKLDQLESRQHSLQVAWLILNEVMEDLAEHFAHEESLMECSGFPEIVAHRDAHRRLAAKVRELASRADLGCGEICAVLRGWLEDHAVRDRSYAAHVQAWQERRLAAGGRD